MSDLATTNGNNNSPKALKSGAPVLDGAQKSLLFLVSVEEPVATRILAHLSPDEVKRLREASDALQHVEPAAILSVHREFASMFQQGSPTSLKGSGAYLRRLAGKALGEGKAAELWTDKQLPEGPVAALSRLDIPTVLGLLEPEQPQTLAVILSQLDSQRAGELIARFPVEKQAEVVRRMARLQSVPESVIEEIEKQFETEIASLGQDQRREVNGIEAAAGVLKRLQGDIGDALLEELTASDAQTADQLRKAMFTFEDLVRVDGRGMQALLKEVATDQLTMALKTASEQLREKIFGNVSSRAAAMLRDELEMLGPVRLADVETAQRAIVDVAMQLERDGRIQIAREGGAAYV